MTQLKILVHSTVWVSQKILLDQFTLVKSNTSFISRNYCKYSWPFSLKNFKWDFDKTFSWFTIANKTHVGGSNDSLHTSLVLSISLLHVLRPYFKLHPVVQFGCGRMMSPFAVTTSRYPWARYCTIQLSSKLQNTRCVSWVGGGSFTLISNPLIDGLTTPVVVSTIITILFINMMEITSTKNSYHYYPC